MTCLSCMMLRGEKTSVCFDCDGFRRDVQFSDLPLWTSEGKKPRSMPVAKLHRELGIIPHTIRRKKVCFPDLGFWSHFVRAWLSSALNAGNGVVAVVAVHHCIYIRWTRKHVRECSSVGRTPGLVTCNPRVRIPSFPPNFVLFYLLYVYVCWNPVVSA